jgi:hypothetical protein
MWMECVALARVVYSCHLTLHLVNVLQTLSTASIGMHLRHSNSRHLKPVKHASMLGTACAASAKVTPLYMCALIMCAAVRCTRAVAAEAALSQQLRRWQLRRLLAHVLSLASFKSHNITAYNTQHTRALQCASVCCEERHTAELIMQRTQYAGAIVHWRAAPILLLHKLALLVL